MNPTTPLTAERESTGGSITTEHQKDKTGDETLTSHQSKGEISPPRLSDRSLARLFNTLRIVIWILGIAAISIIGFITYNVIVPVAKLEEQVSSIETSIDKLEHRIERIENNFFGK